MGMGKEGEPQMTAEVCAEAVINTRGDDIAGYLTRAYCPQLDVEYYGSNSLAARRGLYASMRDKARAINKQDETFPIKELKEPAGMFLEQSSVIRRRLIRGKVPPSGVVVLVK